MTEEIIRKKQYWIEFIGFSKKHCNYTDEDLAEHIVKMIEKAINFAHSSTKLPSIETLTFDEFLFTHFYKLKGDQYLSKESNKTYDLKTITAEYDKWLNK